jgi:hypothetical protein
MEIWKDIEEYEGLYQVSNLGKVKSLKRIVYSNKRSSLLINEKLLKQNIHKSGYYNVSLSKNNTKKNLMVHRLVCMSFLLNKKNKSQVNHKNGIKTDNRLENLEWVTASENRIHAYKIGLCKPNGENHHLAKLTENQVKKIRYEHKNLTQKEIAKIYNIKQVTVSDIRKKRNWKHI